MVDAVKTAASHQRKHMFWLLLILIHITSIASWHEASYPEPAQRLGSNLPILVLKADLTGAWKHGLCYRDTQRSFFFCSGFESKTRRVSLPLVSFQVVLPVWNRATGDMKFNSIHSLPYFAVLSLIYLGVNTLHTRTSSTSLWIALFTTLKHEIELKTTFSALRQSSCSIPRRRVAFEHMHCYLWLYNQFIVDASAYPRHYGRAFAAYSQSRPCIRLAATESADPGQTRVTSFRWPLIELLDILRQVYRNAGQMDIIQSLITLFLAPAYKPYFAGWVVAIVQTHLRLCCLHEFHFRRREPAAGSALFSAALRTSPSWEGDAVSTLLQEGLPFVL